MSRPLWKKPGYIFIRSFFRIIGVCLFRYRCYGRGHMPEQGPLLICSNHQSYFDPIVVGIGFNPMPTYLARKTLFRFPLFGWLIAYLEAIPIDRDGMGLGGFKNSLRRLKRGEMVVIFPEGTRSPDGNVGPLKPGFVALARRTCHSVTGGNRRRVRGVAPFGQMAAPDGNYRLSGESNIRRTDLRNVGRGVDQGT